MPFYTKKSASGIKQTLMFRYGSLSFAPIADFKPVRSGEFRLGNRFTGQLILTVARQPKFQQYMYK